MSKIEELLTTSERDYVVDNKGNQVKVADLKGKIVGLYFSAHWCPPCKRFTPLFAEIYNKLKGDNKLFEVVFISSDRDEEAFKEYHGDMPWLAVPFSDRSTKEKLSELFEVQGIPTLVIVDENGETITTEGVEKVMEDGVDGYPFKPDLEKEAAKKEAKEKGRKEVMTSLDYAIDNKGNQVKVADLKGKIVGLYFSAHWCPPCRRFTPLFAEVYKKLKAENKSFEVIFVSSDRDEEAFKEYHGEMPWLALPFSDRDAKTRLSELFDVEGIPQLILLDENGEVITTEGVQKIMEDGVDGYPFKFDPEKEAAKKAAKEKGIKEVMTSLDYAVDNKGNQVKVADLKGKIVGLYFSAHWCPPCRMFTPLFADIYNRLKAENKSFEVIFVSSDRDEEAFKEYHGEMPWLALPFSDRDTKMRLSKLFDVEGIPTLILLDENGQVITKEGLMKVVEDGVDGYPFKPDPQREEAKKKELEDFIASLPKEVTISQHPHPLQLHAQVYRGRYGCDVCGEGGQGPAYHCDDCGYDCHPKCAK
eukprot:TRINITY_DN7990_c0_g1_i5.p1 TRINITY_DN7990_c0_g1~~TRINITY_DN7990_c0_g1_i5.p1  ORF type:complete len:531 (-),score=188.37 TRINITY_DN7990_c0_g1_i5:28-1620(-)